MEAGEVLRQLGPGGWSCEKMCGECDAIGHADAGSSSEAETAEAKLESSVWERQAHEQGREAEEKQEAMARGWERKLAEFKREVREMQEEVCR